MRFLDKTPINPKTVFGGLHNRTVGDEWVSPCRWKNQIRRHWKTDGAPMRRRLSDVLRSAQKQSTNRPTNPHPAGATRSSGRSRATGTATRSQPPAWTCTCGWATPCTRATVSVWWRTTGPTGTRRTGNYWTRPGRSGPTRTRPPAYSWLAARPSPRTVAAAAIRSGKSRRTLLQTSPVPYRDRVRGLYSDPVFDSARTS